MDKNEKLFFGRVDIIFFRGGDFLSNFLLEEAALETGTKVLWGHQIGVSCFFLPCHARPRSLDAGKRRSAPAPTPSPPQAPKAIPSRRVTGGGHSLSSVCLLFHCCEALVGIVGVGFMRVGLGLPVRQCQYRPS